MNTDRAAKSILHCAICARPNRTLHWHKDAETSEIWVWCQGKCQRGYSIYEYCAEAGISLAELLGLLRTDDAFQEAKKNEINAIAWPRYFHALSDPDGEPGVKYLESRGLKPGPDIYYDSSRSGVVLAYYYQNTFAGAQIRYLEPKPLEDGGLLKITTLPGTRLGYLFWGWSQNPFPPTVKYVIVAEGAFNALSIQQSLNEKYGNMLKNPFRCIATSGSGLSEHQVATLKELIESGIKVVGIPDTDPAGLKMLDKMMKNECITHYALVNEDGKDWNDLHKSEINVGEYLLTNLKKV